MVEQNRQTIMQTDEIYVTPLGFGIRIDGKDSGYLFPSRETAEAYVPTLLRNRRPVRGRSMRIRESSRHP